MNYYSVYVYGAGHYYNELMSYLPYYNNIIVKGIITTQSNLYKYIDGYECISVDEADWDDIDYCIVAVSEWWDIKELLTRKGLKNKIIRSHVFKIPFFNFERYLKLYNSKISILSNYCLGGHLYRQFGLEMRSPTVNMYCSGMQYIDFLQHYHDYLQLEMHERKGLGTHIDGTMGKEEFWPHGIIVGNNLREITWILNHDREPGETVGKWNERRLRVNDDNIAAIMIVQSDEEARAFDALDIKKKIGFYYKELGLNSVICVSEWLNKKNIIQYDSEFGTFINDYMRDFVGGVPTVDWLSFLLGDKDYIRKH